MLRFVGNGDQKKFTKNPRHFSMQNSQANTTKKKIHKMFLESRQSSHFQGCKNTTLLVDHALLESLSSFSSFSGVREGVNREKLTVKKIINNEMFFFTVNVPYKP